MRSKRCAMQNQGITLGAEIAQCRVSRVRLQIEKVRKSSDKHISYGQVYN